MMIKHFSSDANEFVIDAAQTPCAICTVEFEVIGLCGGTGVTH